MRKHNRKFAQRFTREKGDRSNLPQQSAHALANDKGFQLLANPILRKIAGAFAKKKVEQQSLIQRLFNLAKGTA